ncbi:MAG: Gfo/Idh/MocA family oxidoreductase [Candidatus Hydrogenedentes bacterium]|nr:Gfo/Idh/MocA family oxidoreductase [Candidatus Hydrogenedentota bacterium]
MFRLGIIGSDNSHAEAFASLANLEEGHGGLCVPDVQVTHIYGTDPKRTKEVAEKSKIPNIVTNMEDMIGAVDGVLCVWRHGSKHCHDTVPFLKAKIPAFVDKPLAASVADAKSLIATAQQTGVGFTSFSTLRYERDTVAYIEQLKREAGTPTIGVSTGPADPASEYDGIFFYGIHAVELMNAVWGYGCKSVTAVATEKHVQTVCAFENGSLVTLNFLHENPYVFHVMAFGKEKWLEHTVESKTGYYDGMLVILETLKSGKWPLTAEQLLEPVAILAAIQKSLAEKRTVAITEVSA